MNTLTLMAAADTSSTVSPNVGTIVFLGATAAAIFTLAVPLVAAWRARSKPDTDETPDS
jgi:hypothetical protein